jgi:hypothetical protein
MPWSRTVSWKYFVPVAIIMIIFMISLRTYQDRNFSASQTTLQHLQAEEVEKVIIFFNRYPNGQHIELTTTTEIEEFIVGLRNISPYFPNHEVRQHEVSIIIEPQQIHLQLAIAKSHPNHILGGIGMFKNGNSYRHYGSFLSEDMYPWFEANLIQLTQ